MSTIHVGYPVRSKQTANKVIGALKRGRQLDGAAGTYSVRKEGSEYKIYHTLTDEELQIVERHCILYEHKLHVSGFCVNCHAKVEDGR